VIREWNVYLFASKMFRFKEMEQVHYLKKCLVYCVPNIWKLFKNKILFFIFCTRRKYLNVPHLHRRNIHKLCKAILEDFLTQVFFLNSPRICVNMQRYRFDLEVQSCCCFMICQESLWVHHLSVCLKMFWKSDFFTIRLRFAKNMVTIFCSSVFFQRQSIH
jgi:hypothetical protein